MHSLLQIALNENSELVSIYSVPNGIKCNCKCPECGGKLEAKNNGKTENTILRKNQKIAHFAHLDGKECNYAPETIIHLLAKKVLEENKKLKLPELRKWGVWLHGSRTYVFDEIALEKKYEHQGVMIIPDATLKKGENLLFIEFFKTHPVDLEKKSKIKHIGVSTIEINLNHLVLSENIDENYAIVKHFLEESHENKKWIFNRKIGDFFKKLGEKKDF